MQSTLKANIQRGLVNCILHPVHNLIIDQLAKLLEETGQYQRVEKKVEYEINGLKGEVDVLGIISENKVHFFEVKCHRHYQRYIDATNQYYRYCRAHPDKQVWGFYICPKLVCEIGEL